MLASDRPASQEVAASAIPEVAGRSSASDHLGHQRVEAGKHGRHARDRGGDRASPVEADEIATSSLSHRVNSRPRQFSTVYGIVAEKRIMGTTRPIGLSPPGGRLLLLGNRKPSEIFVDASPQGGTHGGPRIRREISAPHGVTVASTSKCRRRACPKRRPGSATTSSLCAGSRDVDGQPPLGHASPTTMRQHDARQEMTRLYPLGLAVSLTGIALPILVGEWFTPRGRGNAFAVLSSIVVSTRRAGRLLRRRGTHYLGSLGAATRPRHLPASAGRAI
jgi:hypothetical protein